MFGCTFFGGCWLARSACTCGRCVGDLVQNCVHFLYGVTEGLCHLVGGLVWTLGGWVGARFFSGAALGFSEALEWVG